ncbi:hypothetical protein GCM10009712_05020 [Pseudarthrobacter sulfonivorans]
MNGKNGPQPSHTGSMNEKKRPDPTKIEMEQVRGGGSVQSGESDADSSGLRSEPTWLDEDFGEDARS